MQIKTIGKVIKGKLNNWLATIDNEQLVKDLRTNILVSGGSITSMLLNEEVNDYDIYINDMDVLKRVVEYYAKGFDVGVLDGRYYINSDNESDAQYAVAKRTLKEDQIKLYLQSGGMAVNEDVEIKKEDYIPLFFSPNAISLSNDIQIVCRFHGDNKQIHKTFDFIHATNYFTFQEGLVTNKRALESILTKQLFYQGSLYPLTSIIRMKKFIKRGWNISAGEMLKSMFQVSELDLKNPDVLEEQLIGVDVAYFSTLIEILRGTKSEKMESEYLNKIIDKVFNEDGGDNI